MHVPQEQWMKVWTTEYSLFSVGLFGREYTKISFRELGAGFEEVIFLIEKDLATVFRRDHEQKQFAKAIADKLINEKGFEQKAITLLTETQQEFETLLALTPKEILVPSTFQHFIDLHSVFLPYYVGMIWAPNALVDFDLSEEETARIFDMCEKIRKQTEPVYPALEKGIQRVLEYIATQEQRNEKLLRAVLPEELLAYISSGTLPDDSTLKERYEYSVLRGKREANELITGDAARSFISDITEVIQEHANELSGVSAMKGIVRGIVHKAFSEEDLNDFKEGEILVTTMTRPSWVPAMKKAGAFVTDAGGVLCHAAIVAREMKKPCVIGTKVATQMLENGDEIEVDADNGIVKIL